ncbi:two-component response regulator ORR24-like [Momordica charantia]|uniref:Two-component response regulator ORR24-like n=1 Tax=Momordica charantia TaxID=3673 RepID=A0A6J1DBX2_MOMCH|nr:two-component response regulator ORR24-like [Momordica charantia]
MANAAVAAVSDFSAALSVLHQTGVPVVLMSTEMNMKAAGKSIAESGFHFLEKPISMEDIELVWQLVYRKIRNPRANNLGENANQGKKSEIGGMCGRVVNVARGVEWNAIEEEGKENYGENFGEREARLKVSGTVFDYLETTKMNAEEKKNRNECTNKRSRIVWNSKLHRKFTEALSKLGNKKSSPKIILKMMNEPSLTLRQVASHLQKFKSQVKHLNKITESDASTPLSRVQLQQLPVKQNSITNILGQPNYSPDLTDNQRQFQVLSSCLNGPQLPFQNVDHCHLRMMDQSNSNSYGTTRSNDLQPETYGGFKGMNLVADNRIFGDELCMNESSESFVQTSQSNLQYFSADVDYCPFLSADAVQELEFARNLAGCLDVDNITSGTHRATLDSLNQNVYLKELDDLLNNTAEDPMVYCCFDGEVNSFDIDQYSQWLNA